MAEWRWFLSFIFSNVSNAWQHCWKNCSTRIERASRQFAPRSPTTTQTPPPPQKGLVHSDNYQSAVTWVSAKGKWSEAAVNKPQAINSVPKMPKLCVRRPLTLKNCNTTTKMHKVSSPYNSRHNYMRAPRLNGKGAPQQPRTLAAAAPHQLPTNQTDFISN